MVCGTGFQPVQTRVENAGDTVSNGLLRNRTLVAAAQRFTLRITAPPTAVRWAGVNACPIGQTTCPQRRNAIGLLARLTQQSKHPVVAPALPFGHLLATAVRQAAGPDFDAARRVFTR